MESVARKFDLTMLYAAYDAFRRDTARLEAAAGSGRRAEPPGRAVANSWSLFTGHWRLQDRAEKAALWTVMYAKDAGAGPSGGLGRVGVVLDAMALRAVKVVPLIDGLDAALEHRDQRAFALYARDLRVSVDTLLDFKEANVLPLIQETLTPFEWGTFDVEFRRELGLRGLGVFLPWLLDGAPAAGRRAVLRMLPPPIRLFYRARWRPRYMRRTRLAGATG
ncbi:hypothetical protein LUW76_07035 [Actinomadura madurae]|uniref:hypothetical protein n=1 Tax=Actinomadura madurae TaxID=1993 RepID=UPI002027484D|nr:hypothetical protein [Actinomadura madurae]URM94101.1 hypothetical protein LUW76_07035 [Actinomadura madurae]URN04809.1 hypothetical protein LUW74_16755 [Actinomadura madurae]